MPLFFWIGNCSTRESIFSQGQVNYLKRCLVSYLHLLSPRTQVYCSHFTCLCTLEGFVISLLKFLGLFFAPCQSEWHYYIKQKKFERKQNVPAVVQYRFHSILRELDCHSITENEVVYRDHVDITMVKYEIRAKMKQRRE